MPTTFNLSATVQDADMPDLLAAAKVRYATNGNPNPTQGQLRTAMEAEWRQGLVAMVRNYRRDQVAVVDPTLS